MWEFADHLHHARGRRRRDFPRKSPMLLPWETESLAPWSPAVRSKRDSPVLSHIQKLFGKAKLNQYVWR